MNKVAFLSLFCSRVTAKLRWSSSSSSSSSSWREAISRSILSLRFAAKTICPQPAQEHQSPIFPCPMYRTQWSTIESNLRQRQSHDRTYWVSAKTLRVHHFSTAKFSTFTPIYATYLILVMVIMSICWSLRNKHIICKNIWDTPKTGK